MVKKRSRKILLIGILLFIILILAVIIYTYLGTQSAQGLVPKVTAGDFFTYEVKGLWSSTDPNATISDSLLQLNMTEWYRVTITDVSGTEVSTHNVWRFTNGTELEENGKVDVETGLYSGGFWAIYAADLRANDRTRVHGIDQSTINQTITRNYGAGGTRETNLLVITSQFSNVEDPSRIYNENMTIYFDRQIGNLVELRNERMYNIPEMSETILWKLIDSNVWNVS